MRLYSGETDDEGTSSSLESEWDAGASEKSVHSEVNSQTVEVEPGLERSWKESCAGGVSGVHEEIRYLKAANEVTADEESMI